MVAPVTSPTPHGAPELRARRTWRGKVVIQVRYALRSPVLGLPSDRKTEWRDEGKSRWRDANADDLQEVAAVVAAIRKAPTHPVFPLHTMEGAPK